MIQYDKNNLVTDLMLTLLALLIVLVITFIPAHSQTQLVDRDSQLWGNVTGGTPGFSSGLPSGTQYKSFDARGTLTDQFEVVPLGTAAATLTVTIVGCMPGDSCSSTVASSTGVGKQTLSTSPVSVGPFAYWGITVSWTGGDTTTAFRINRLGVLGRVNNGGGTVNSSTQYNLAYYPATGPTVSGTSSITTDAGGDLTIAGIANAASFHGTGPGAGQWVAPPGDGTCNSATALFFLICNLNGTGVASLSDNNGLFLPILTPTSLSITDEHCADWSVIGSIYTIDDAGAQGTANCNPVTSVASRTGVVTLTSTDVGLASVTNDAQTKASIVPNTAPSAGQALLGNAGGTAYAPQTVGGDGTMSSSGTLAITKINSASVPAAGSLTTKSILAASGASSDTYQSFSDLSTTDYIAGGGSAQAQTATLAPAASALTTGLRIAWLPVASNTSGAPTLAVNGLTATAITKCGTTAVIAGDILINVVADALYDGTQFELLNPQATPCATNGLSKSGTYSAGRVLTAVGAGNTAQGSAGIIVTSGNTFSTYNAIATVGSGVPFEPATIDLTAQSAAVSATNLYLPATTQLYRITGYLKVTTAGTSSILGGTTGVVITYTDGTDSVAQSVTMSEVSQSGTNLTIGSGNPGNSTTTVTILGPTTVFAKTAVQMQYAIGYSSTGTTMVYEAHLRVEQL